MEGMQVWQPPVDDYMGYTVLYYPFLPNILGDYHILSQSIRGIPFFRGRLVTCLNPIVTPTSILGVWQVADIIQK
jgi:hypothetical protein